MKLRSATIEKYTQVCQSMQGKRYATLKDISDKYAITKHVPTVMLKIGLLNKQDGQYKIKSDIQRSEVLKLARESKKIQSKTRVMSNDERMPKVQALRKQGLTYAEISEKTGISTGSISALLNADNLGKRQNKLPYKVRAQRNKSQPNAKEKPQAQSGSRRIIIMWGLIDLKF